MAPDAVRVAVVGAGTIAGPYTENLQRYPETELVGVSDLDRARADALAEKRGVGSYPTLDALLADDGVDVVVNLTIHHAHYEVTKRCLEAGKHVYSEKPLALHPERAWELCDLARTRGVRLACSPFTFLGEAQQTAWRHLRSGALGTVRLAYAEVNWGRIETWHPNPEPFYDVGVLWDVGLYPLTLLSTYFGPAKRVDAFGRVLYPQRRTKEGRAFDVTTPDFVVAVVEFEGGTVARLTAGFYAPFQSKQTGLELHGDAGSLYMSRWDEPNARLEVAEFGEAYRPLPLLRDAGGIEWGRGVRELALALLEDRPSRVTGEQAAHVVDILAAVATSLERGDPVAIDSSFPPPAPMEWAT